MAALAPLLQMLYLTMACSIYLINSFATLRGRFVTYGARASVDVSEPERNEVPSLLARLLNWFASWTVPHAWFLHFYVVSVGTSAMWALSYFLWSESACRAEERASSTSEAQMAPAQVTLAWLLMLGQGARRLWESKNFQKPSTSRMWVGHWVLGIFFYVTMSVSIWCEGMESICSGLPMPGWALVAPSMKTLIGLPIFFMASGVQHDCHGYLASLKKYSLPQHPAFLRVVAPHYLAECVIYLALSIITAPVGFAMNKTVLCALAFVGINLGITARDSREWYAQKFGEKSVSARWCMIPFIY